jgi:hypothetical protein
LTRPGSLPTVEPTARDKLPAAFIAFNEEQARLNALEAGLTRVHEQRGNARDRLAESQAKLEKLRHVNHTDLAYSFMPISH